LPCGRATFARAPTAWQHQVPWSKVITGAFVNTDGSVVVVFTNSGTSAQSAQLAFSDYTPTAASAWVTSNSATFASTSASLSGGKVTVSIPARGVVTVKLTG
jgi:O-glycosyl hydrolase